MYRVKPSNSVLTVTHVSSFTMAATNIISKVALRSRKAAPSHAQRCTCHRSRALTQLTCYQVLHSSNSRRAITNFQMPAMSPTMTEGGIASWKKKEGESFVQGDVLLEIVSWFF